MYPCVDVAWDDDFGERFAACLGWPEIAGYWTEEETGEWAEVDEEEEGEE